MLENYLNVITNMENYIDGILVVDKNMKIAYMSQFREDFTPLDEKKAIGKNFFDIYPDMKKEESTIWRAIKYGEVTLGHEQYMRPTIGRPFRNHDDTYPIIENEEIIGAICITTFPDANADKSGLKLYHGQKRMKKDLFQVSDIIGCSEVIQTTRMRVQRVSKRDSAVLIYGATGTGKELVAQSIHSGSSRSNNPFISQNCAAIPENLLESIFFGTTKGSFTGAEDRAGIFEAAKGGTVFLDEINSMDQNLQAKLLRVLEQRKVTRVGATKEIDIDVRVIAAVNQEPQQCIREGKLREDLFYRLSTVLLELPTLQERKDDIELLTDYFISQYNESMQCDILGVSQDVMNLFQRYAWPGNIRELRNVIEGAFNLCGGNIISPNDLPSYISASVKNSGGVSAEINSHQSLPWCGSLKKSVDECEKNIISETIYQFSSLSAAADYMGISRQVLSQKMKKYGIKK